MVSLKSVDEGSTDNCKCDTKCEKEGTNQCDGCGEMYCLDHYLEHEMKIEKYFEYLLYTHRSLIQKLKLLISKLLSDDIYHLIKQIYEFKIKSDEIEKTLNIIEPKLKDLINKNKNNENNLIENDIEELKKDIKELKLKFQEINNSSQKRLSDEQLNNHNTNDILERKKSTLLNRISLNKRNSLSSNIDNLTKKLRGQESTDSTSSVLSHLLFKQMSPSIIDINENELDLTDIENNISSDEEEEHIIDVTTSDSAPRSTRKIRLSNNIIKYMRGPLRIALDGTMHAVEVWAHEPLASESVQQAVKKGLDRQKQILIEQQTNNKSIKLAYAEITSDWKFLGENSDRGFSSASIWMRDPQGRRILVKIQDHPLCAANEWLAYVLGKKIGLPINEVQIAIYENKLVTLHTDVTQQNEKIFTFMDLPKQITKKLLTDPILQSMDLFDRIIQNVDRNPRNILITMDNNINIDDDSTKLKIYLIDHSSCFGMGKLNGISVVACKFHSQHLSVVKFDPIEQTKKFERYLIKLPTTDRILIRKTLNRFASIHNDQIDTWMIEIQDLLSPSQYNRIHDVLYKQRDIVRRYTIQWGLYTTSSSLNSIDNSQFISNINDTMTYF